MNHLTFSVESKNIKIKELNKGSFLELEMYCLSDVYPNRNNSAFTKESMIASLDTFYNKPVLGYFSKVTKDFEEHNYDLKFDEDGKIYEDFEGRDGEKAIGMIRESDVVEIVEKDGLNWIRITCGIWVKYNRQQVRHLLMSKRKKVSIECIAPKTHMENGIEVIDEFVFNGVTILGNTRGGFTPVNEGIPGAHLKLLEFVNTEACNTSLKAMSFASKVQSEEDGLTDVANKLTRSFGSNVIVEDVYLDGYALLQEPNTGRLFTSKYSIDGDNIDVSLADRNYISESSVFGSDYNKKIFIESEKIGKGQSIPVDFSKEAVSDDSWGSISKTDLRNKVLASENYRQLVGKAYLVALDGWEDAPSSNLRYPIAQMKNGKFVINRDALNLVYSYLQKDTNMPYYKKAMRRLNSLKRIAGMETEDNKTNTEEKKVMKNKFIGMPSEFKYIHSAGGRALFAKDGQIFAMACGTDESEEVEFRAEALMAASLFVKERENPEGEDEEIEMTEALMSFIKDEEDIKCSIEQKLAAKEKDIEAKDEEIRMAKEESEKFKADIAFAKAELEMAKAEVAKAEKTMMVERVKEMASKEELLSEKDRSEIMEMAERGELADTEACGKEVAMRVYNAMKSNALVFKLPKNEPNKDNEDALQKASRLVNKKNK